MEVVISIICALSAAGAGVGWWRANQQRKAAARESDRLRNLLRERGERPSVFSHEVRTPLTLIKGAAELLSEETPGPLNARQRVFVSTISENANTVIELAEDLLAEAQLDAQLFDLTLTNTDLRALARQTVRELQRVHSAPMRLDSQGPPLFVWADRTLIRQALTNLINNAARHAGAEATITIRVASDDQNAVISVSDTGTGMTERDRETLFQPFSVGSSRRPGTGLGMMIVKRIVDCHHGTIMVDTVADQGTSIFFTLPLEGRHD